MPPKKDNKIEDPALSSKKLSSNGYSLDCNIMFTPFAKTKYAYTSFEFDFSSAKEPERIAMGNYITYIKALGMYKGGNNNLYGSKHNAISEIMKIFYTNIICSYDEKGILTKFNIIFMTEKGSVHRTYEMLYMILCPTIVATYARKSGNEANVRKLQKILEKTTSADEKEALTSAISLLSSEVSTGELGYSKNMILGKKNISAVHIYKREADYKPDYIEKGFIKYATKVSGSKNATEEKPESSEKSTPSVVSKGTNNVCVLAYLACVSLDCGIDSDGKNTLSHNSNSGVNKVITEKLKDVSILSFVGKMKQMLTKNYKEDEKALMFNIIKYGILNGLSIQKATSSLGNKSLDDFKEASFKKAVSSIV